MLLLVVHLTLHDRGHVVLDLLAVLVQTHEPVCADTQGWKEEDHRAGENQGEGKVA